MTTSSFFCKNPLRLQRATTLENTSSIGIIVSQTDANILMITAIFNSCVIVSKNREEVAQLMLKEVLMDELSKTIVTADSDVASVLLEEIKKGCPSEGCSSTNGRVMAAETLAQETGYSLDDILNR